MESATSNMSDMRSMRLKNGDVGYGQCFGSYVDFTPILDDGSLGIVEKVPVEDCEEVIAKPKMSFHCSSESPSLEAHIIMAHKVKISQARFGIHEVANSIDEWAIYWTPAFIQFPYTITEFRIVQPPGGPTKNLWRYLDIHKKHGGIQRFEIRRAIEINGPRMSFEFDGFFNGGLRLFYHKNLLPDIDKLTSIKMIRQYESAI